MSAKSDVRSGVQKVAAFLLTLEKPAAATLLKKLDAKLVPEIAAAMTALDPSFDDRTAIAEMYRGLARELNAPRRLTAPDATELGAMLEGALGRDRAKSVLSEIEGRRKLERPFAAVENEPPSLIALALAEESPAVAALALAHLEPELAAEILSTFAPERALDVVRRMSTLIPPRLEVLASVATELAGRITVLAKAPVAGDASTRLKSIAQMLNFTQKEVEKAVLEGLESENEEVATEIREFMFTWEDLAKLDKRGMQKVLSSVETRTLAVSLKACSKAVEDNILNNLSTRVRAMVADERELAGPMPMAEVLVSRGEMMKGVRALLESGELNQVRGGEELVS